jgi:predicted dehydrogenase
MTTQIPSRDRIRLGVIGCAASTLHTHVKAIAAAANVHLLAVADPNLARCDEMRHLPGPPRIHANSDDLLADPQVDLVLVGVQDLTLVSQIQKALATGKHVLIDQPASLTVEDYERLRPLVAKGQILALGYDRRFLPGVRATRQFLQDEGGDVMSYSSYSYDSPFRQAVTRTADSSSQAEAPERKTADKRISSWLTHGPALLDIARHLVGPITAVRTTHHEVNLERTVPHGVGGPSHGYLWCVEFRFANGSRGYCSILQARPGAFEEGFELHCAGGHVTCSFPYTWFQREHTRIYSATRKLHWTPDARDNHTFRLQLEALARTILNGAPLVNADLRDGVACAKVLLAGSGSAMRGGQWFDTERPGAELTSASVRGRELAVA